MAATPDFTPPASPPHTPLLPPPAQDPDTDYTLRPHASIPPPAGPLLLILLSGIAADNSAAAAASASAGGGASSDRHNAVRAAATPVLDAARAAAAAVGRIRTVRAAGEAVGLPAAAAGAVAHSEASHLTLACGRALPQAASLVDAALASGALFRSPGWRYLRGAFAAPHTVHFIGLLSDGGVHSSVRHLTALLRGAASRGARRLRVHVLLDGRDVPDGSSVTCVDDLESELAALRAAGCDARVASGGGRMRVTMDRYESNWAAVKRGWDAHVLGEAPHKFPDPLTAVIKLRGSETNPVSDQHLEPFVIVEEEEEDPVGPILDGDGVVLFNFRSDRMTQLVQALEAPEGQFTGFDRGRVPKDLRVVGLTRYCHSPRLPSRCLVAPARGRRPHLLTRYLAASGVPALAVGEPSSAGHLTFCWNGNAYDKLHDDSILDEHRVVRQDVDGKGSRFTTCIREALHEARHRFIRVLLPDADLAAHTGDLAATIRAVETVDAAVGELISAVDAVNGRWLLTSDHGNADDMVQRDVWGCPLYDDDGRPLPYPGHTNAPVPVLFGGAGLPDGVRFRSGLPEAGLANVTATLLNLLGFGAPCAYEPSLLEAR
ncbi:hypothetical protein VOLCADRAFT_71079 [Volvox carteri f. nagariensis]|uniref:phosphoglycerate mutase (2,3-diphosphoglycerate-independent) n=1 Tax=Volvox carteri f. nagariensis TaxID=3068 RepID=D8ULC1_VOLCA|nr:uncharacterized protein VOLCADRAFT_71079 [Volvox carteri f. nagariensis]EFJ39475.1 hypothetical protein VOLCADRAFT_71079 [Volvox carteri f. nagariensis]|eukprot:XP_002959457.1 hypothetical protein VOLCADRAFT_71079 [Volvox carteri f. nagariensis]